MDQFFSSPIELIFSDVFGHFGFEWSDFLTLRCVNTAACARKYSIDVRHSTHTISYGRAELLAATFYGNGFGVTVPKQDHDSTYDLAFTADSPLSAIDSAVTFIKTACADALLIDCPQTRRVLSFLNVTYDIYGAYRVCQSTRRGVIRHAMAKTSKISDLEQYGYHYCPDAVLWTNCHYPVVSISERLIRAGPIRLYNACVHTRPHTYMYGMIMYVSDSSPEELRRGNEYLACDLVAVVKL